MRKLLLLSLAISLCATSPMLYAEPSVGAVAKHQALLDVGTDLRLMCVAAHPDDEDGATLAMYRKKYGYKTFAVLATRGEGGQNEIGPELYEELAVLRTDEMARASKITGAELHFLNLPEFGYSKSKEETWAIWGQDVALERMVRKIRELRPDVIITHHPPQGGHGHHQAIGHALQDAFDIAGDPKAFPEHLDEGLQPWQPARLYVRSFRGGNGSAKIILNELDPFRGYTYAEIAAQALREHETQGMGFFIDRFLNSRSSASYGLAKERAGGTMNAGDVPPPGGSLFEGLRDRVTPEARALSQKSIEFVDTRTATRQVNLATQQDVGAIARANALAIATTELRLSARVSDTDVVAGQTVTVSVEARDYGAVDAQKIMFELEAASWFPVESGARIEKTISKDGFATAEFKIVVPENQSRTVPHDQFVFSPHFLEPQLSVVAYADVDGTPLRLEAPIVLDVSPAVSVEFVGAPYLVQQGADDDATLKILVTNHSPQANDVTVRLSASEGLNLKNNSFDLTFTNEGDQKIVPVSVEFARNLSVGDYPLKATVASTGYVQETTARVVDVTVPADKNVGVIFSYDDTFMNTLDRLNVPHEALEIDDFIPERLDEFTTIIVDIRAYLVRPDLVANNQALLDYVHRGGTMIVMYQKTFEWNSDYAPYDLQVGRNRVTVEEAPMEILVADHPLFNVPNKIVPSDWDGWKQERGLYFPSRWADEYTPLINVADPGESPPPGSCLIAQYGDGTYMYTALGWYRQLRELHPGTIRIFANMLAL